MDRFTCAQQELLALRKQKGHISPKDIDRIMETSQLDERETDGFIVWINQNDLAIETAEVDVRIEEDYDNVYYQQIAQYPLLTPEEEKQLAERVRKGDLVARDTFIKANLRLVIAIAQKYRGGQLTVNDLIQEGNIGLIKAVNRFDPDKGIRFAVYASYWIRQAMSRAIIENRAIHLPVNVSETLQQLDKAEKQLEQELGRVPNDEEIAESTGLSVEQVETLKSYRVGFVSIDRKITEDSDTSLAEIIPGGVSAAREVDRKLLKEQLAIVLKSLDDRNMEIISLRFGLDGSEPRTLQEIGEIYGLSKERVRQIVNESLATIKKVGTSLIDFVESADDQQTN